MMNPDEIRRLSTLFRDAIERCDRKRLPVTFLNFPSGSCGDAALLLARYLSEHEAGFFDYVLGLRGTGNDRHSHAWLEAEGIIIDISADQFDGIENRVIVTNASAFHDTFERETQHRADYRIYDDYTVSVLDAAYFEILAQLPEVGA